MVLSPHSLCQGSGQLELALLPGPPSQNLIGFGEKTCISIKKVARTSCWAFHQCSHLMVLPSGPVSTFPLPRIRPTRTGTLLSPSSPPSQNLIGFGEKTCISIKKVARTNCWAFHQCSHLMVLCRVVLSPHSPCQGSGQLELALCCLPALLQVKI